MLANTIDREVKIARSKNETMRKKRKKLRKKRCFQSKKRQPIGIYIYLKVLSGETGSHPSGLCVKQTLYNTDSLNLITPPLGIETICPYKLCFVLFFENG